LHFLTQSLTKKCLHSIIIQIQIQPRPGVLAVGQVGDVAAIVDPLEGEGEEDVLADVILGGSDLIEEAVVAIFSPDQIVVNLPLLAEEAIVATL